MIAVIVALLITICSGQALAAEDPIARKIIALYIKKNEEAMRFTKIHRMAEMPLNHLGLKLEYYDANSPLPDIKNDKSVRGVISWFTQGATLDNPEGYIKWASDAIDSGKKFVIMGEPGFFENSEGKTVPDKTINRLMSRLGVQYDEQWIDLTYDVNYTYKNPHVVEYERKYAGYKPPYPATKKINDDYTSHLIAQKGEGYESDLIVTGPNGGYITTEYASFYEEKEDHEIKQWYINPFEFFRLSFSTDDLPKPDTTTIAGRRIYYSHIDGDGWNNQTLLEEYNKKPAIAAEVILEKVIKGYKDLPVTVATIAADIDKKWAGSEESIKIAKKIFKQPNVELGSHTYSHPFSWHFFKDYTKDKELPLLSRYGGKTWADSNVASWFESLFSDGKNNESGKDAGVDSGGYGDYEIPRAYASEAFSLEKEISGSIKTIEDLAPENKKVNILMWSGDTSPFERALKLTRDVKIRNINGGDSRFDRDYPSLTWVSPIGRQVGEQQQIYASNSNENTYTDLWTGKFFGFKYLINTIENTESPIRTKPFNVYYHMYSGEKQASLSALLNNLNYARKQKITPVSASFYSSVADGFYSADIIKTGDSSWKILNRDHLQTIRFDNNIFSKVDFEKSKGVIGQLPYQGRLYVYLDEAEKEPVIYLDKNNEFYTMPGSAVPYLIDSRFRIYNVEINKGDFFFTAEGFGTGSINWKVPDNGAYDVTVYNQKEETTKTIEVSDKILNIKIGEIINKPVIIKVHKRV